MSFRSDGLLPSIGLAQGTIAIYLQAFLLGRFNLMVCQKNFEMTTSYKTN